MFLFKKIVAPLFFPIPFSLTVSLLGLFFLWFTSRQKTGKTLATAGICIFGLLSFEPVGDALLSPLDLWYGRSTGKHYYSRTDRNPGEHVEFVVVLGGGHITDPSLPITSQINTASLVRVVEGIRVYKENPGSKLIFSGGSVFDPVPEGQVMADIAVILGVEISDIIIEPESRDTKDQAVNIKSLVGDKQFVLVTSASHMCRSMGLFRKRGMEPIPAPTDHLIKKRHEFRLDSLYPNGGALDKSERAVYEYLGIMWAKLRGQI